ncbi:MAG: peptide chain release factor N(5)-glutamine methyltransferase [Syntrophomonas sp.]|nr:peptide chain release factor N(5)-glutamine methyltransferase [Syntrophomonas sp.]
MRTDWTIKDLLSWTTRYFEGRGMQGARLEAEILLAHALQKNRVYLYANYDKPVNANERQSFRDLIKRRSEGEPSAYITGQKEFMSLSFDVSPDVLIPRPETEVLVEIALGLIEKGDILRICDIGTGSGAIAVSLAYYAPKLEVVAVDISPPALRVACGNADKHQVNIRFCAGDLLAPLVHETDLDMIIANLPYLTENQFQQSADEVRRHEPRLALVAGHDGLEVYRRLLPQALEALRPGGHLLLEIDPSQDELARDLAKDFSEVEIVPDWSNRSRVIKGRKP